MDKLEEFSISITKDYLKDLLAYIKDNEEYKYTPRFSTVVNDFIVMIDKNHLIKQDAGMVKKLVSLNEIPDIYIKVLDKSNIKDLFNDVLYSGSFYELNIFMNILKKREKIDLYPHLLDFIKNKDKVEDSFIYLFNFRKEFKNEINKDTSLIIKIIENDMYISDNKDSFSGTHPHFIFKTIFKKSFNFTGLLTPNNSAIVTNYMNSYFKKNKNLAKGLLSIFEENEIKLRLLFNGQDLPQRLESIYKKEPEIICQFKEEHIKTIWDLNDGFKDSIYRNVKMDKVDSKEISSLHERNAVVYLYEQSFDVSRYCYKNGENITSVQRVMRSVFVALKESGLLSAELSFMEDSQNMQKFSFIFLDKEKRDLFAKNFKELNEQCLDSIDTTKDYSTLNRRVKDFAARCFKKIELEDKIEIKEVLNTKKTSKI